MPADIGVQTITVKFFDPVDSDVANRIGLGVRKIGIYSGGYLTKVDDVTATLTAFDCEIGDGTYQIRGFTTTSVNITVSPTLPYIIARWTYTGDAAADYMEMLGVALGSITDNDIIIGLCNFSGSTLTGFSYTSRTNPNVFDLFLKVEPTVAASMYVRVRAGHISYGTINYTIVDQLSPLFTAPSAGLTRIDLVQVTALGAVAITQGTPVAIPSTPTAPSQGNLVTLAEVLLIAGQTTIVAGNITDTRNYVSTSLGALEVYDSGWFAVSIGTSYEKTHSLDTTKVLATVYISDASDGDGRIAITMGEEIFDGAAHKNQTGVRLLTATTVTIRTGSSRLAAVEDNDGNQWMPTSGYCRIVMLALA